jgi:hypothetical protein
MNTHSDSKAFGGFPSGITVSNAHGREMRARQNLKIGAIKNALRSAGFLALDEQAGVLGLSRSTTWTILRGKHKSSGLSAAIINRMLGTPQLPSLVRIKILEYVGEKNAGLYGHTSSQLRKFKARLSMQEAATAMSEEATPKSSLRRSADRRA